LATTNIDRVKELGLQEPEFVKLKAADGKTDVYGILFKPADFDPKKNIRFMSRSMAGLRTCCRIFNMLRSKIL
jgi:hypothetical protein